MAETAEAKSNDALLANALNVTLPVNPAAETVKLTPPEPQAPPVDFSSAQTNRLSVGEDYKKALEPSLKELGDEEERRLKFEALQKVDEANRSAAKVRALGESAAQQRREILDDPARAEYRKALEDKAKPFIPHQDNAQDLMTLFGLLNVVGFAIGASGKENAQAAMSAMNGMLEGHQKGRDDLYKKEKSIFETNQKQLDSRIKQLMAFMQDNELLSNMDKTARDQAIEGKFLEDGATFLLNYYRNYGYGKSLELLKQSVAAAGKAAELASKEQQRADDNRVTLALEKQKAEQRRQEQRDKILADYNLKELELNQKAEEAKQKRDWDLAMALSNRAYEMALATKQMEHAENLAKINRDHASDIEKARIARDEAKNASDAAYHAADQVWRQKVEAWQQDAKREQQEYNKKTLAERERHDKEMERLRAEQNRQKGGAGGGQRATQQMFVVQRAVNALGGVASAVEALGQLPSGTTTGVLGNLQTKDGMFNFIRNSAARTMSSSESKAVETLFTGITRNLAAIEASGAATGLVGLATQIEKLRPVAGDTAVDVALKMADIRRIATENIQPLIDSGLMPKQQADTATLLVKRIEKAIPYTTQQVVEAAYGGKGKQTITEAGQSVVGKDEKGSFHWEYNEDKTKRRKVYD